MPADSFLAQKCILLKYFFAILKYKSSSNLLKQSQLKISPDSFLAADAGEVKISLTGDFSLLTSG